MIFMSNALSSSPYQGPLNDSMLYRALAPLHPERAEDGGSSITRRPVFQTCAFGSKLSHEDVILFQGLVLSAKKAARLWPFADGRCNCLWQGARLMSWVLDIPSAKMASRHPVQISLTHTTKVTHLYMHIHTCTQTHPPSPLHHSHISSFRVAFPCSN